jgi:hypothetical protein
MWDQGLDVNLVPLKPVDVTGHIDNISTMDTECTIEKPTTVISRRYSAFFKIFIQSL